MRFKNIRPAVKRTRTYCITHFLCRLLSTPRALKDWFINSDFQKSPYSASYLEDAIAYTLLKKFGGVVLPFDILLLKSISGLGPFFARCDEHSIESVPLALDDNHPIVDDIFTNIMKHFDGTDPSSIGSKLITSTLKKECKVG